MKVPGRVPDPLKQKFLPLDSSFEVDYSKHVHTRDGYELNVKYLMDCTGEFTNFVAFYCGNSLSVRRIHDDGMEAHHIFIEELIIQDVEYFRSSEGGFGITVALNSTRLNIHPHCVALFRWSGDQLKHLRKLKIEEEISCLKVVADEPVMNHLQHSLHPRMSSWPHIIAVGTRLAHCYLLHFHLAERHKDDGHAPVTVKLTDGLKPFHSGDHFIYNPVDPCTGLSHSKKIPTELVDVTCINFLDKSRTVLVGFSFGGIMTISLTTCPTIDPLIYPCSAPVRFIAPMEPDDDPRSHLWFFAAYGVTKVKPLQLCLYEVMFPDEEALPLSERTWNKPVFTVKLLIPFLNSTRWVSTQTLLRDRAELRGSDESTRDSSRNGSDKDRSLVFFSYIASDKHGFTLKGGLFDLNAYYYKRLVQVIAHDGTAAQQCAFLSSVHPIPVRHKEEDFSLIKDLAVDTTCITRFISNICDAEQMFYPSAFEISVVHVAGAKKCYQFTLPSLPNQVMSTICADLEMHVADAGSAWSWLAALGFSRKDMQPSGTEQYNNLCSVLYTLISHQRAVSIVQFIKHSESNEMRHLIAKWIWEEIDKASKKMHETIEPLFARFSAPLSPAGQKSLAHVHDVFVAGLQILRELINTCEREQDETREYLTSLEVQRFATENLRSYSAVIHQLMKARILPVAEDREIRLAMEEALEQRRLKASEYQLNIDKLVTRMQRKSPSEPFWLAEGPKWYPPALLNLLGPILLLNIPTKWKGQLLAYYLLDYAHCKKINGDISDSPINLVDIVTKQMHGLLGMNKEEMWTLYKLWCADTGAPVNEDMTTQGSPSKRVSAQAEVKQLLSIPRPLSVAEEEKLKSLLKSIRFGEFAWQCYLARNNRHDQFKELPLPPNENNEIIMEYQQLLPVMRMLRRNNECSPSKRFSWPTGVKEAIDKFERARCTSIQWCGTDTPVFNRGKTPKPLMKRKHSVAPLQQKNTNSPPVSTESDKTASVKRALLDLSEDESVSLPRNIPTNTLNTITDILRTPQARARAAAQAESQRKWTDKTPEIEFQRPAPRSILKSARAISERAGSPSRNRLQFDLPSSSHSSLEKTTSVSVSPREMEKMAQPNFEESFEYEDFAPSPPLTEEMDVVSEGFAPYISPGNSPEIGDALEKSLEVQDEDELEEVEPSVVVEQQDEEEVDDEEVSLLSARQENVEKQGEEQGAFISVRAMNSVGIGPPEEKSIELQDEEEEEEHDEEIVAVREIGSQIVVQQDEHKSLFQKELIHSKASSKLFEKQDEQELLESNNIYEVEQEEQDEAEILDVASGAKRMLETSYEEQDESFEHSSVNIFRYESVIVTTSEAAQAVEHLSSSTGPILEALPSAKMQPMFQDDVEVAVEVQDEVEGETGLEVTALASGDSAHFPESTITAVDVDNSVDSNVKLVDYSFHESTFECTPNKLEKLPRASDEVMPREMLQFDAAKKEDVICSGQSHVIQLSEELKNKSPKESPLPEVEPQHLATTETLSSCNLSSGTCLHQAETSQEGTSPCSVHNELPIVVEDTVSTPRSARSPSGASSPHSPEPNSSTDVSESKHRSPRKHLRTSAPTTPVRHSQRLREKAVDIHHPEVAAEEKTQLMELETEEKELAHITENRMSPVRKVEEVPHLTMSLRSRNSHNTSEDKTSREQQSQRRSPARTRATKEAELVAPGTPPQSSREDNESDNVSLALTPTRNLRPRTPSRSRKDDSLTASAVKRRTSRRVSETSVVSDSVIATGSARKSPSDFSRGSRTRRLSNTEEEQPVTSSRKSPSRRTPTRSLSAAKQANEASSSNVKTRSYGKAAKALQQKFDIVKPLGDMDARTYFDMPKKSAEREESRRRTRSDSEIPDIKAKKLKTLNIEETIAEVDEETATGPSVTRARRKLAADGPEHGSTEVGTTETKKSATRPRRASSATVAELTPTRTRRTSGSSVSSVGTPSKSPSRRGRPRGIETIPE